MKTKAIIFDLDGTLTNTLPLALKGCRETVKRVAGKELTDAEIAGHFGKTEGALFKEYCGPRAAEAGEIYSKYFYDNADKSIVFPGIFEALDRLKAKGIRTALVTGRGPGSAKAILEKTGLAAYFEQVKPGSEFGSIKPQCIKEVLGEWGQPAENSYYIGDIPHDARDARAAAVTPLSAAWVPYADKAGLEAEKPLKIFNSVRQFLDWIDGNL